MDFFDRVNIAEREMTLINPASPEKVVEVGRYLGLRPGDRVLDYGCGFAEPLTLWAEAFGISGVGVDIRPYACERARARLAERGQSERIEIVCGPGADYPASDGSFDNAVCLGASFVFGGFRPTMQALRRVSRPGRRIAIGEPYWRHDRVPVELTVRYRFHTEVEILRIAEEEGYYLERIVRSTEEDWDRYQSDHWAGLMVWLTENPDHPDWQEVRKALRSEQEGYLQFEREHLGWAMYVFA
ncbi:MAG: class I SAM-dependent methyltransferase [Capsulimonadales bacterium]|nr:class I SAM-dependent methyltransferase [Capsulimonadales bacterium]